MKKEEQKGPEKEKNPGSVESGMPKILNRSRTEIEQVPKKVQIEDTSDIQEDLRGTQEDVVDLQERVTRLEEDVSNIDVNYLPAKYFGYAIPIVAALAFGLLWLFGYPVAYGAITILIGCIVLGILAYGYRHGWFSKPKRPGIV